MNIILAQTFFSRANIAQFIVYDIFQHSFCSQRSALLRLHDTFLGINFWHFSSPTFIIIRTATERCHSTTHIYHEFQILSILKMLVFYCVYQLCHILISRNINPSTPTNILLGPLLNTSHKNPLQKFSYAIKDPLLKQDSSSKLGNKKYFFFLFIASRALLQSYAQYKSENTYPRVSFSIKMQGSGLQLCLKKGLAQTFS